MKTQLYLHEDKEKVSTNKIINMSTYSQKQKIVIKMRQDLQIKTIPPVKPPPPEPNTLKFRSFNINGLRIEAGWAVQ